MAVSCAVIRIGLFHIAIPPVLGADAVTNRDQTPGVHSPILDRSPGERSRQGQDICHAERQTNGSNFRFQTDLHLEEAGALSTITNPYD